MNNIKKHITVIWYFIFSLMLPFASLYGDANINGKVIHALSGIPAPGINIILLNVSNEGIENIQATNNQGLYQFANVQSGQYKVQMELPTSYVAISTNPLLVTVEDTDLKFNFSLGIPGNMRGLVIDSTTHLPITNANVDIMRGDSIITSVLTDENGIYNVIGLAPRPYIVRVRMPYFQSGLQLGIPIPGETVTIDFALRCPPGKIKGQVVGCMEEPLIHATVDILQNGIIVDSVQCDENGNYTLSEIAPNHYEIKISALDFQSVNQSVTLSTNQTLTANFALKRLGTVAGHVLHAFTGEPIEGVSVGIWQNDALFASTSTDVNGYFSLSGLGDCQIVVQARNFYPLEQRVELFFCKNLTLDFNMVCFVPKPPKRLHGKVVKKIFAHQINFTHFITWEASPDPSVVSYRLYCESKLLIEVSADDIFSLELPWRSDKTKKYQLRAVNGFGQESFPLSIYLPPRKDK